MKSYIVSASLTLALLSSWSQPAAAQVLQAGNGAGYRPVELSEIESIGFDTADDIINIDLNTGSRISISYTDGSEFTVGKTVPLIEITTDEFLEEIPNKTDYKKGTFLLKGFGEYEDNEAAVDIRGRGNSSWSFIKKPYRLKFGKKISLCGLPSAKNYVLLANYMDCSLSQNTLAFKIGEILGLPFTNNAVPVDVILNGKYKGSYILTNKPGINAGSVDIDETKSIMWELDVAYDEDFKFMSPVFSLPVMAADPDLTAEQFEYWKNDFIEMEKAVYDRKAQDYIDMDIAAGYLAVYEVLKNDEIGWPKSFKLYKTEGGKYIFGPIWDFDGAMGKVWMGECYMQDKIGNKVWRNGLLSFLDYDPSFQSALKNHLKHIIDRLPELLEFIDSYAREIRESALRNQILYPDYEDFDSSIEKMKDWLCARCRALQSVYNLN